MADLIIGPNGVSLVHLQMAEIHDVTVAELVTAGQAGYKNTAGKGGIADANVAGKQQFRGIFLKKTASGKAAPLLKRGFLAGYDLSGLAYDAPVYLSNTAGCLSDSAGAMSVIVGRVCAKNDPDLTKILYIEADWLNTWS